ncbi:recombinase family protein, partial [Nocardia noduli]|uniref:recombinase family protein n=1 Tax=Nocardia noduli TaxID=2815722 RepID=UPI001C238672
MVDHEAALNELLAALTATSPDAANSVIRAAFVGRTSTEDNQDPTLSIPRQVSTCHTKLKSLTIEVAIVAYYWDIETGRLDLDRRGHSDAHQRIDVPTPRDGGISDLLTAAASPDPGFDVVITEHISRTARDTRTSIEFEYHLTRHDIPLWCADEPIDPSTTQPTATNNLLRGMNRIVADWYTRNLLEQSRGGTIEHVKAGYNIGRTPYGYLPHRIPHPVPAKRARGQTKTILTIDPDTAPIVATIFDWRTT